MFRLAASPGRPDLTTRWLNKQVRAERGDSRRTVTSDGGSTPPASTILFLPLFRNLFRFEDGHAWEVRCEDYH